VFPNEVVDVEVQQCSGGGPQMERAVEKAVWAAKPFPEAPHRSVFERRIIFDFKPGG